MLAKIAFLGIFLEVVYFLFKICTDLLKNDWIRNIIGINWPVIENRNS